MTDVDCRAARPTFTRGGPAKISDVTGGGLYLLFQGHAPAGRCFADWAIGYHLIAGICHGVYSRRFAEEAPPIC
ncbi:hypothetical protein [Bradyrhizobium erythrophlei]|uniref:hypothetical protein n=1 Tax=Bradyrhizobium erythrophlei TaxID=1437360 RepID=UPI00115FC2C3|nr:hypothetical protein [Bradyrhizobium erythrophlei]